MNPSDRLPLSSTVAPASQSELSAVVQESFAAGTSIYPIGGGTSLSYGLPAKAPGIGLSLAALSQVIDYPASDLTITVEAGVTMRTLAEALARERQQLPVDVPQAEAATIGGVIATNWNGPRRFGLGSLRDYVIGISAVDGRGQPFKGGGRVVKNVAGYDFCKLLTGSFGVLGVITQVTMKVRPLPEESLLLATQAANANQAERLLAALNQSPATPVGMVLLAGPHAGELGLTSIGPVTPESFYLVVALEGTAAEVQWMHAQLNTEWNQLGVGAPVVVQRNFVGHSASGVWSQVIEWPADPAASLILKANLKPSGIIAFIQAVREIDLNCSILAHAASGVVFVKFSEFPKSGLSRVLIGKLQPAAASLGGQLTLVSNPSGAEMTAQSVWGGNDSAIELMRAVKRNFDPKGILNPGRFVV